MLFSVAQHGTEHLETNLAVFILIKLESQIVEQMKINKFLIELLISN